MTNDSFHIMFTSERIARRFEQAIQVFLEKTHNSRTAHTVVDCLLSEGGPVQYGGEDRNEVIQQLAKDVEAITGVVANLMFRSEGHLHDCLQTLMDAYWDAVDGIYYKDKPLAPEVDPEMCLRH